LRIDQQGKPCLIFLERAVHNILQNKLVARHHAILGGSSQVLRRGHAQVAQSLFRIANAAEGEIDRQQACNQSRRS
jgi:hypothetical protein